MPPGPLNPKTQWYQNFPGHILETTGPICIIQILTESHLVLDAHVLDAGSIGPVLAQLRHVMACSLGSLVISLRGPIGPQKA